MFIDLLKHYGFSLVDYLARRIPGSPRTILAMVRHLPADSLSGFAMQEEAEERELSEEEKALVDAQFWTTDRKLLATLINDVRSIPIILGNWDGNPPKLDVVGPREWQDPDNRDPSKGDGGGRTLEDVLGMFTK